MKSTAKRPIAILSAPGSRGDVNPMVAIGAELKRRGIEVVISLAEQYAPSAAAAGIVAEPVVSSEAFNAMLNDPQVWKPLSGVRALLRDAAAKFVDPHLEVIAKHHRPGRTVLVAHPLDFASRIYHDHDSSTPLATVLLSPAIVRNFGNPARLTSWWFEPRWPPLLVKSAFALADRFIVDPCLCPAINAARRRYGLEPVRRVFDRWWLSPDLIVSMYPTWFGEPIPRGTASIVGVGFALPDQMRSKPAERDAIFFTSGTAHRHGKDFFLNAIDVCQQLGRRGILATSHREQLPEVLPDHITSIGYEPLEPVLRRCVAMVHHGGIGTTAMGLRTACPQLICPLAFDQFHHADRVAELGVGLGFGGNPWRRSNHVVKQMAGMLYQVIESQSMTQKCAQYAARNEDFEGAINAANEINVLLSLGKNYADEMAKLLANVL